MAARSEKQRQSLTAEEIVTRDYPETVARWPERSQEIKQLADALTAGMDVDVTGAAGCGKTVVLETLLREIHARKAEIEYVYVHGQEYLTLQGLLRSFYTGVIDILRRMRPPVPRIDRIVYPNTVDDFDNELSSIRQLLHPFDTCEPSKRIILVFDRCRQAGGDAFFRFFDRNWRNRYGLTNTTTVFVDEYDIPRRAEAFVEFRAYTADQASSIMDRIFPPHESKREFFIRYFGSRYAQSGSTFRCQLSKARDAYEQYVCNPEAAPCGLLAEPLTANLLGRLNGSLNNFARLLVVAGYCCRNNPAEYDKRIFKRDYVGHPKSEDIVENNIYVGKSLEDTGEHAHYAYLRYGEKPFKWCRYWAWVTCLHSDLNIFKHQPFPSLDDARALALRPLVDAHVLEISNDSGPVLVQSRATSQLAKLCSIKLGMKLNDYIVQMPMGTPPKRPRIRTYGA